MIKFLDDEPFASYYEHGLDGKRYVCLGDDWPLCETGNDPDHRACFNVIDLDG